MIALHQTSHVTARLAALLCAVLGLTLGSSRVWGTIVEPTGVVAPVIDNRDSPPPNLEHGPCVFGNDFDVTSGHQVVVASLGAFDDRGNGLEADVLVGIYDRISGLRIAGTTVVFKAPGINYELSNQTRWQSIAPVTLPPGKYTVVAANYGPRDSGVYPSGYSSALDPKQSPLHFDSVAGALRPGGGRWLVQKGAWDSLPERITGWSGVLAGKTVTRPIFATGTLCVRRDVIRETPPVAAYIPPQPRNPPSAVPDQTGWWINGVFVLVVVYGIIERKRAR